MVKFICDKCKTETTQDMKPGCIPDGWTPIRLMISYDQGRSPHFIICPQCAPLLGIDEEGRKTDIGAEFLDMIADLVRERIEEDQPG